MKHSLVIGARGLVGEHISRSLIEHSQKVTLTHYTSKSPKSEYLDIRNRAKVQGFIKAKRPDIIYLPAAATNVDFCEENPSEAFRTNVSGVKNLIDASNKVNARLVYFSSDYIFDGIDGPYTEDSIPNPICEYGKQKLIAEYLINTTSENFVIIRTTVVYGWERNGKNFIARLIKTLQANQEIKIPVDQIGSPTYAPNLAKASIELAMSNHQGVFNICGTALGNRYEFACEAAKTFGLNTSLIQPIQTHDLKQPASRPLRAGMLTNKAAKTIGIQLIDYREGLKLMKKDSSTNI